MPANVTLPNNQEVKVPLIFRDNAGVVAAPTGGSVSSSDTNVATASVASDDQSVTVIGMTNGTCVVTYTNGTVSDTLDVTVVDPVPTSVSFDVANEVFSDKP